MSIGLLIGGSSSVGKTTLARQLVLDDASFVQTDMCLPTEPALTPITSSETWSQSPRTVRDLLIGAAEAAVPYIRAEAEALANSAAPWVIEGERIHPSVVMDLEEAGIARGLFVVESSASMIAATLMGRASIDEELARIVAEVNRMYGLWLIGQAEKHGLRWIRSRPWRSLRHRALRAVVARPPSSELQRPAIGRDVGSLRSSQGRQDRGR